MINIENVKKSFQGLYRPVLDGVNLNIAQGDFCILIGANGCGKSTLFKLINGEYKADDGKVLLGGNVYKVSQDINITTIHDLTLLENMILSEIKTPKLMFYRRYRERIIAKLKELNLGLEKFIDQPLKALSGGQKQIIATFMAMNMERKILLLDEHTSALDLNMQKFLMEYTASQIKKLGMTTIMITHKLDDAIKYGNRLIMLHQGKVVLDVTGLQKQALTNNDLLTLFYKYDKENLLPEDKNDY